MDGQLRSQSTRVGNIHCMKAKINIIISECLHE